MRMTPQGRHQAGRNFRIEFILARCILSEPLQCHRDWASDLACRPCDYCSAAMGFVDPADVGPMVRDAVLSPGVAALYGSVPPPSTFSLPASQEGSAA